MIKNLAQSRIAAVDVMTDGGIADATGKMKMAMFELGDSGNRLIKASSKFVDAVIQLAIFSNELVMARQDLERAKEEVTRIEEALDDFEQEKADFWEQREDDRKNYEDEINRMKEEYDEMTEERREEFKKTITALYDKYKESFNAGLEAYQGSIGLIIQSIHNKWIGLRDASMSQRSMALALFLDYCDAKFYHSFQQCDESIAPSMSDSYSDLLDKLIQIQEDTITDHPEGVPTTFHDEILFLDKDNTTDPVTSLITTSVMQANLTTYDVLQAFATKARVRLTSLSLRMKDSNDTLIPSPGTGAGKSFEFKVTYPLVFRDKTTDKDVVTFLGQRVVCLAGYYTFENDDGEPEATDTKACEFPAEFAENNFQPSLDGVFSFNLTTQNVDLSALDKVEVILGGNYIPLKKQASARGITVFQDIK